MKRLLTVAGVGLVGIGLVMSGLMTVAVGAIATSTTQEAASSVLDGVFTAAQARRGRRVYNQNCSSCHGPGPEMSGGEMAPSIAGNGFIVYWTELPVGSLFERIRVSMPEDGPGRLSDQEYADVVAYMLDSSSYPAGEVELPTDKAALDEIMIVEAE